MYKERFNYILYDIKNKEFVHLLGPNAYGKEKVNLLNTDSQNKAEDNHIFQIYPWETISPNGKIIKKVEPLTQYVDNYGQVRLVEFQFKSIKFVGQFEPLPCLKLPIKPLDYFIAINGQLNHSEKEMIQTEFGLWCTLYFSNLNVENGYMSPYSNFRKMKRLAEYILWAACYSYSQFYHGASNVTINDWIDHHTRVVDGFTYSKVTIQPIFNLSELMVDGKFIFNSTELQERVRFNLSLISPTNLKFYTTNIYHTFFKDIENFNVVFPAQLALTKQDYFQRTREPYVLNILTSKNIQYLRSDTLYFIKELFGIFLETLCLFQPSLEKLIEKANQLVGKTIIEETIMNATVFDQKSVHQYSVGRKEPSINIMTININGNWFYGLFLPNII